VLRYHTHTHTFYHRSPRTPTHGLIQCYLRTYRHKHRHRNNHRPRHTDTDTDADADADTEGDTYTDTHTDRNTNTNTHRHINIYTHTHTCICTTIPTPTPFPHLHLHPHKHTHTHINTRWIGGSGGRRQQPKRAAHAKNNICFPIRCSFWFGAEKQSKIVCLPVFMRKGGLSSENTLFCTPPQTTTKTSTV
jgi:hypothetical protein